MIVVLVVAAPLVLALFALQMEKLETWILPSSTGPDVDLAG